MLKLLLDRGANMEQRAAYAKGVRALHVAAMADAKAACLELLRRGADFGAVDDEFKTVVELASLSGAVSTLELLVSWEQHGGEAPREPRLRARSLTRSRVLVQRTRSQSKSRSSGRPT